MNCSKCDTKQPYGAKYCNTCGEKFDKGAYEEEYNDTVWSKLDKAKDKYDTFFLKKITGSVAFKIISLLLVCGYLFFTLFGNFRGIRLNETDAYTIEYNKKQDEYYIYSKEEISALEMYVPFGADSMVFTEVKNGKKDIKKCTLEEYKKNGYSIKEGEYEYVLIQAKRNKKEIDNIKVIVVPEVKK